MSIEKARNYFKQFGIESRIQELSQSSATVELAAQALGCEGKRIAKTLSFIVNEQVVLILTAGDAKIDNAKYKEYFHVKARMLNADDVEPLVGHNIGGVCPFGINDHINVYLDASLQRFETVFPACGSSNSAIEMTLDELQLYSKSLAWIDVCKAWQEASF